MCRASNTPFDHENGIQNSLKGQEIFHISSLLECCGKYSRVKLVTVRAVCSWVRHLTFTLPLNPGVKLLSANGQENSIGVEARGEKQARATQNNMEESG